MWIAEVHNLHYFERVSVFVFDLPDFQDPSKGVVFIGKKQLRFDPLLLQSGFELAELGVWIHCCCEINILRGAHVVVHRQSTRAYQRGFDPQILCRASYALSEGEQGWNVHC